MAPAGEAATALKAVSEPQTQTPYPFLVRTYVEHVKPHTKGRPAKWGPEWVAGTHLFGRQLMWTGAVVVVASWLHGELGWRVMIGAMGLLTSAAGAWHRVHAQAICDLALKREQDRTEV